MSNVNAQKMPKGIFYIVGNEAAERFSYYGMRGILVIFMTKYLLNSAGEPAMLNQAQSLVWYHNFATAVYFFPLIAKEWFLLFHQDDLCVYNTSFL